MIRLSRLNVGVTAANKRLDVSAMDISAAYLQGKYLDREVIVEPPEQAKVPGMVWRLRKAIYGLKERGHKFDLKVKASSWSLVAAPLRVMKQCLSLGTKLLMFRVW